MTILAERSSILLPLNRSQEAGDSALLHWIVRLRWGIFAVVGLIILAGYNGQWRIGRDGSLYRAVAHSIATGHGYTFRGERQDHIYPGLPRLLATIETVFHGQDALRPTASLVVMLLLSAITLVVIYHLVQLYYPRWLAVCVTAGVGVNREFMQYAHDLMTDVPFLLGVCLVLLGLGWIARHPSRRARIAGAVFLATGTVISVSVRPTFWALVVAILAACAMGLFQAVRDMHSRKAWWSIGGIAAATVVVLAWWALDPRTKGFHPWSGRYERVAMEHVRELTAGGFDGAMQIIRSKLHLAFEKHFPDALIGLELIFPFGTILTLTIVGWSIVTMRRVPLWGLYVLATLAMTIILGSKPRYYLMAAPLTLVAWGLAVRYTAAHVPRKWAAESLLFLGLGVATAPNLVRCFDFILEQHGLTYSFERKPFLELYRQGKMLKAWRISRLIAGHAPANAKVIGPEPRITTFLSGRNVYHPMEILGRLPGREWKSGMERFDPDFVVAGNVYDDDRLMVKLLSRQIIPVDRDSIVRDGEIELARIGIAQPIGPRAARYARRTELRAQRQQLRARRPPATQPATRPAAPLSLPQDLFISGQDGYHTYRIPSLLVTGKGTLLAFAEGRKNGRSDSGHIDVVMKRSTDNGRTWSAMQIIASDPPNTIGNPCPAVDRDTGKIWLPLTRNLGQDIERDIIAGKSKGTRTVLMCSSQDDGLTWSKPVDITSTAKLPNWTWYATGPGVGIQLRSGRLLIPCDHQVLGAAHSRSHVIYSDDHGQTWKIGGIVGEEVNECQAVELENGLVMMNMRSYRPNGRFRAVSISRDGGLSWSALQDDPQLIEPVCQGSLVRFAGDATRRARLLFCNPASQSRREKLTLRVSANEGRTWPISRLIYEGSAAYSCLAVLSDTTVGCLYERDSYQKITFVNLPMP